MCGILGLWSPFEPLNRDHDVFANMLARLKHRGPDGSGQYIDEAHGLAMGHTRLSIVDLKTGGQPLCDTAHGLHLTVNGEFYDYKRIRADLVLDGFTFQSRCDSEIALKLYAKHGFDFTQHLRGEFALALFDEGRQQLLLARDRFGIRPVYYFIADQKIIWASEIKSLLEHPDVPKTLCPKGQLHQLLQLPLPGMTQFRGIHAVKPGHMLVIKRRRSSIDVESIRYWDAEFPEAGEHVHYEDQECIEQLQSLLAEAVNLRTQADAPLACYLSNTPESTALLGLTSAFLQSPVRAFSLQVGEAQVFDKDLLHFLTEHFEAEHTLVKVSGKDVYGSTFERAVWYAERSFGEAKGAATLHLSQIIKSAGYKVVLTADGANEIFAGYPSFLRDMQLHDPIYKDDLTLEQVACDDVVHGLQGVEAKHPAFEEQMGFTPSWLIPHLALFKSLKHLLLPEVWDQIGLDYDPFEALAQALEAKSLQNRAPLDKAQYSFLKTKLESQVLNWGGDRVDVANLVESRPVFLDLKLAEFAFKLSPHTRIRHGVGKWILREAIKHMVPKVLLEQKTPASLPVKALVQTMERQGLEGLSAKYLDQATTRQVGLFRSAQLEAIKEQALSTSEPDMNALHLLHHAIGQHVLPTSFRLR